MVHWGGKEFVHEESYTKEYLVRHTNDLSKKVWKYPQAVDEQLTETIQIIPYNVIGAWDDFQTKKICSRKLGNHWRVVPIHVQVISQYTLFFFFNYCFILRRQPAWNDTGRV